MASRLLVLGADDSSHRALVQDLLRLCAARSKAGGGHDSVGSVESLTLRTKYYSADVEAHLHQVVKNEPVPALVHDLHEYEAVLCVVDPSDSKSFAHVRQLLEKLAETEQFEVCLLVGDSPSTELKKNASNLAELETWCQDNAFELIGIGASDNQAEADEKRGVERVLEALECNMWSSMVRATPASQDPPTKTVQSPPQAVKGAGGELPAFIEDQVAASMELDNQTDADNQDDVDDTRLQALVRALEISSESENPPAADQQGPSRVQQDTDEDDLDMREFSSLLEEVRRVREHGHALSDEQRRQQAAQVAMRLWEYLDAEEDEDDSSSE